MNKQGSIVRQISFLNGELLPNETVESNRFNLGIKFKNTGRLSAVINQESVVDSNGKLHEDITGPILISGLGETGWISVYDVSDYIQPTHPDLIKPFSFYFDYAYQYKTFEQSFKERNIKFRVYCSWKSEFIVNQEDLSKLPIPAEQKNFGLHCWPTI